MSYWCLTLVPIAAVFLRRVNEVSAVHFLGAEWQLTLRLPFSWKVLYFAAVAGAISESIYLIWCPELIRRFPDFRSFQAAGNAAESLRLQFTRLLESRDGSFRANHRNSLDRFVKKFALPDTAQNIGHIQNQPKWTSATVLEQIHLDQTNLPDAFTFVHEIADEAAWWARASSACFLAIAGTLSFVVFCQGFWAVISAVALSG